MKAKAVSHADRVADQLRRAIIARDFAPGERLTTALLSERFQVSQTPLREAFARLAGEGWVSYYPQRGVRVADFSVEEMLEIYEIREILEPMAVSRSTMHGNAAWRQSVQRSFDSMIQLAGVEPAGLDASDYDEYEHAHMDFHRVLTQECGSQWLIRLTATLSDQSMRFRRLSLPLRSPLGSVRAEHERLCLAALAGDADEAAEAALVHMQNTRRAIMTWIAPKEPVEASA